MIYSAAIMLHPGAAAVAQAQPPPYAHDRAPAAADHVAIEEVSRGYGTEPMSRNHVSRSGSWIRIDGTDGLWFSDFSSGTSVSHRLGPDGSLERVSLARSRGEGYARVATGERHYYLGELCEVWRTTGTGTYSGVSWLSCDTPDGIRMWSRAVGSGGTVLSWSRTLEFQRRDVQPEEIRPPADALDWENWRSLAQRAESAASGEQAANFEVRLENLPRNGGTQLRIERRRGDWSYSRRDNYGRLYIAVDQRAFASSVELLEPGNEPVSLTIQRRQSDRMPLASMTLVPTEPKRTETVLGEECIWSQPGGEGAIVIISGSHGTCVTPDGIPLRIFSYHRVLNADLTATQLRRSRPRIEEMMPPREIFEWAAWGIDLED